MTENQTAKKQATNTKEAEKETPKKSVQKMGLQEYFQIHGDSIRREYKAALIMLAGEERYRTEKDWDAFYKEFLERVNES